MNEAIQGLVAGEALYTLFQPIIDCATREPIGHEALTRGPEGPLELPSALIAAAAAAGLSIPLERRCLESALRSFRALSLEAVRTLPVSSGRLWRVARAVGAAGARLPDTEKVTGSNPVRPTIARRPRELLRRGRLVVSEGTTAGIASVGSPGCDCDPRAKCPTMSELFDSDPSP